jgi:hypothetical protein
MLIHHFRVAARNASRRPQDRAPGRTRFPATPVTATPVTARRSKAAAGTPGGPDDQ